MASDKIIQRHRDGKLNGYMYNRLLDVIKDGISDNLEDELIQDAQDASDFGVEDEKGYNLYFFINNLTDDIVEDTFGVKLSDNQKKDLKQYLFSHKNDEKYKFTNLVDFRLLIYDWLCNQLNKTAHPNIGGKNDKNISYNIDKWISTLKNIYAAINNKAGRGEAVKYFTQDWDSDERQSFVNWLKYYEEGNMEKYNVKNAKLTKEADLDFTIPPSWAKDDGRQNQTPYMSNYKINKEKTQKEQELANAQMLKIKMRGRLLSFKRLLDKYNDILPKQNVENIYNEIHNLDISISKLNIYASMQDCLYRSANRIRKFGFSEGAELLEKIAANPAAGAGVIESMPKGISDQPNLPAGVPAVNIKGIIDRLAGLSKTLKSRDMIRELASIDILLNELGLASYFPELTDAQSKLIESYGYASNKVESIIAKLRGSGVSRPKAPDIKAPTPAVKTIPPAKPIDTGEIMNKPVSEVKQELPTEAPKKGV